jgi:hypothetical protein
MPARPGDHDQARNSQSIKPPASHNKPAPT